MRLPLFAPAEQTQCAEAGGEEWEGGRQWSFQWEDQGGTTRIARGQQKGFFVKSISCSPNDLPKVVDVEGCFESPMPGPEYIVGIKEAVEVYRCDADPDCSNNALIDGTGTRALPRSLMSVAPLPRPKEPRNVGVVPFQIVGPEEGSTPPRTCPRLLIAPALEKKWSRLGW